ncbi:AMP-binding enzyme [Desulfatibacillum aliphaticivorans]|uniref:AMP-binding enzyme n=1 Tax=Desulfatibacillum aliphaticivorans TaxID=218208 RepID=UPI0004169FCF|nr:hypothetical protein [Desulfatibacillum aliphaticivorans]
MFPNSNLPVTALQAILTFQDRRKPDEKWGEVPMAVIVPNEQELTEKLVLQFCDGKIARYKLPKAVTFVEALPMTPTGKVRKRVLERQIMQ